MIDTPNKRASLIALTLPFGRILPTPGTIQDEAYRRHLAYLYSGIIPITPTGDLTLYTRSRSLTLYERAGNGSTTLTFVDGTIIEFVDGTPLQQAAAPTNTLTLYSRPRALTLEERP